MIQQNVLQYGKETHGKGISEQDMTFEVAFKRLFHKLHKQPKAAEILCVYGDMAFHTNVSASSPESAVIHIQQGLRDFRGRQHFDMVFYCQHQYTENNTDSSSLSSKLEDFCFCRMLLKPGGFLFLPVVGKRPQHVTSWFTKNRRKEVSWLSQAGFMNITTYTMGIGLVLVGGQRPPHKF